MEEVKFPEKSERSSDDCCALHISSIVSFSSRVKIRKKISSLYFESPYKLLNSPPSFPALPSMLLQP